MKYFKNSDGKVFAFEADGSQDHLIGDMTPCDKPAPVLTPEQEAIKAVALAVAER